MKVKDKTPCGEIDTHGFDHCGAAECDDCFCGRPHERENALAATRLAQEGDALSKDEILLFVSLFARGAWINTYPYQAQGVALDTVASLIRRGLVQTEDPGFWLLSKKGRTLATEIGLLRV